MANETNNLAAKLENATPVENQNTTENSVNLTSAYLSSATGDVKADAFLTDSTIDKQINKISEIAKESKENAVAAGLDVGEYDPHAEEKAKAAAEAAERAQIMEAEKAKKLAEREKLKAEKKERLRQFIKGQSDTDKKLGYSRGFLFGIMFSFCIILLGVFAFKDTTLKLVKNDFGLNDISGISAQTLGLGAMNSFLLTDDDLANRFANINTFLNFRDIFNDKLSDGDNGIATSDIESTSDEDTSDVESTSDEDTSDVENTSDEDTSDVENTSDEDTSDVESTSDEDTSDVENTSDEDSTDVENTSDENVSDEVYTPDENISDEVYTPDENVSDEVYTPDENVSDEVYTPDANVNDEVYTPDTTNTPSVVFTSDPFNANWVMAPNCDKLSCGDYTQAANPSEIIFCSEFSKNENLTDSSTRIGANGKCRYKDDSELVLLLI